jgi:hypothetical protein
MLTIQLKYGINIILIQHFFIPLRDAYSSSIGIKENRIASTAIIGNAGSIFYAWLIDGARVSDTRCG